MFIGRERELNTLEKLYTSDKFEFVVIYGRRRVGKTALIKEFISGKDAIYFMGLESNVQQNLANLSKSIYVYEQNSISDLVFANFQNALEQVFLLAQTKRIVLVIDEYPYVARSDKSLASTLQMLIDKYKDASKLMLILCGSSMSYMEDEVLAYKAPLYGRRTGQIKLLPFSFREFCACFPNYKNEDKALAYGILGGTPQYILQFDDKLSIEENLKRTLLNPDSMLYEEPLNLLKQEVREPVLYNAIITAIANGASRMTDISARVGEGTSICTAYLKNLIDLGLVRKENPYGDASNRKAIYALEDNTFRFWYRFIPQHSSLIAMGGADIVYKRIEPYFNEYMGKVFEEICKQYLWQQLLSGNLSLTFGSMGNWWGNNPRTRKQEEIDIMAVEDKHTALFAECKWTNEAVDIDVLEKLQERSKIFSFDNTYLYVFAKKSFTSRCKSLAQVNEHFKLITFEQMVKE
ncbi:MAG: ATP-binding protein [Phascolarctobacterium sp.]|nr:ATP-binding protein [Phascolarctobacterium sp.]